MMRPAQSWWPGSAKGIWRKIGGAGWNRTEHLVDARRCPGAASCRKRIARALEWSRLLAMFCLAVSIKLRSERPLVLLAIWPMTGTLCLEGDAGTSAASGFNRNVTQPPGNANRGLFHRGFAFFG